MKENKFSQTSKLNVQDLHVSLYPRFYFAFLYIYVCVCVCARARVCMYVLENN